MELDQNAVDSVSETGEIDGEAMFNRILDEDAKQLEELIVESADNSPQTSLISCEERDQLCPISDDKVLKQILLEKRTDPSKFVSYWEMDEEAVDEATEEEIKNNPATRTLWAAEKGHFDILKDLLNKDSTLVNCVDNDGYTPLHRAAYEDHTHIVKYLLDHGAEVNKKTKDGWTPLHSASNWGQFTSASILLCHGAAINAQTNSHQTALHLAASNCPDSRETLELLLMHPGVDFSIKNTVGDTIADVGRRHSRHFHLFEMCEDSLNKLETV